MIRLQVSYRIGASRRNHIDNVAITEGYTSVQDIPSMLGIRNKCKPSDIKIDLIRELTVR
jgi:hypothetical protein